MLLQDLLLLLAATLLFLFMASTELLCPEQIVAIDLLLPPLELEVLCALLGGGCALTVLPAMLWLVLGGAS